MENKKFTEAEVKEVKIVGISSPSRIKAIANERGLNPQEVYVRLIYAKDGVEYTASQQLRILGKEAYKKLRDLAGTDELVNLSLNIGKDKNGEPSAFFYLEDSTTEDDLFSEALPVQVKRTAAPADILAMLRK